MEARNIATIYDFNGNILSDGLQTSDVCDEAIRIAKEWATERDEPVYLDDSDGSWEIEPDGTITEWEWT